MPPSALGPLRATAPTRRQHDFFLPLPRVIFVNRVYWPAQAATAQLLTDLAEGLVPRLREWEVHVIAAGTGLAERNGVAIHRTGGTERHGGFLSQARNYGQFLRRARQQLAVLVRPGDLVVPMTDPPLLGAAVAGLALARGARVVHWVQDIYPEIVTAHVGALAGLPLWPLQYKRNAAWRSAHFCVTLGAGMAQVIARQGVSPGKLAVVANWAPRELDIEPSAAVVAACRVAWGLVDKFIVVYSGNLGRVHDFATVIEAAEQLRSHAEIVFLFIGRGAQFDQVRTAAKARGLKGIRLLPPESRDDLAAALAAADVHLVTLKPAFGDLVYPSKLAGVLAAGRPVLFVGPPDGEIAHLLATADCGQTAAPGDGRKLAETILEWQAAPDRRQLLGRNARAACEKHFTFARALERWEEILRRAAASG